MEKYAVINLKTDPELKKRAMKIADDLGVSISSVLNNELKRFVNDKKVVFGYPETPNKKTAKELTQIRKTSKKPVGSFTYDEAIEHLNSL